MKLPTKSLSAPFARYHGDDKNSIKYRDGDHTPFNKRPGSCESVVEMVLEKNAASGWTNFRIEEITTINGRTAGRTISVTLSGEHAESLAKFILEGNSK